MNVLFVSLHKVCLECELFNGKAFLAVRPALPIERISVILGNALVGKHLWADIAKLDVLSSVDTAVDSKIISETDENSRDFPDIFVTCAVTHSLAQVETRKRR